MRAQFQAERKCKPIVVVVHAYHEQQELCVKRSVRGLVARPKSCKILRDINPGLVLSAKTLTVLGSLFSSCYNTGVIGIVIACLAAQLAGSNIPCT